MDYISYLRSMVGHSKVIMPVAGVFVMDGENRVLLQQRADNQEWGHPGGFMELGETVAETARREIFEETGLRLGRLELLGIYSGPEHERVLPNGDEVALIKIMFICREYEGILHARDGESLELKFFPLDRLPSVWPAQKQAFADLAHAENAPFIK
ncbi:NUDIX hydrolase [Ectobacillus ponti]|uniref:NUDIX domain-containing protein n=1 Tax=Ectobacillus ponti TaxID=2961894 RepID=A0AA41X7W7_9BACI|nr:NUDIX domain-containing protein [Ectobacillus ponti]MCP8967913.1 NUDIX domain-containing protein [Ectobacillus ponti]